MLANKIQIDFGLSFFCETVNDKHSKKTNDYMEYLDVIFKNPEVILGSQ